MNVGTEYKKLKAIDLFAGAGGFSLAAYKVGIDVQAAIELDKLASETYYMNLVDKRKAQTQVFSQDINSVDIDSLMKFQGINAGELDLILGGPPCQGFSTHRINNAGKNDPRNLLLIRYFDFVKKFRPKVFLVENVPGLLWPRHAEYLSRFMALSHEHGYKIIGKKPFILNARDYGVPQNRKRAFILAVREDIDTEGFVWPPEPTHTKVGDNSWVTSSCVFESPSKSVLIEFKERLVEKFHVSLEQAEHCIEKLVWGSPIATDDPCNVHMEHSAELTELFKKTPLLGDRTESGRQLECHKNYNGHLDVYGRIYPHLPSNTITTGCNNPSKGRFVHPWLNHGITLRHAARLQTFPDDYIFSGGSMAVAKQIGNAVPIKLGEALLKPIIRLLLTQQSVRDIPQSEKVYFDKECIR
ncbi:MULTISPECIES: DNA cytosine methyltransferase [Klebsiella pneumoniae complex]|uniref:DNA cytosine methyltransferase n=1 Tax=Klebsiella pneumoniae complex TaxID=3390273 RepID=UPI002072F328|nr:DNA cytosine methyltransferase [Klebsiella pneumoniae]MCM5856637.1 DNA cytosine methyltransferase [Klebsiella pneumoniae]MCQ8664740.1 DNA cytosine methyltransferase [Klebsiella pneumoniae]HBW9670995.1 DNA cytosine methyltransferase [Klebsiella pneumoniae]HDE2820368.1 DNA cytosine methyltransferase [Klebsiella pneumoniae]